ncbi:hypothetical protein I7I50_00217 [Histoplasma capsulatum G186AR]|uniref:Uncharacterized protein n=1 Tax=Ajellomyces capsulatus TaxID=5037 RepID=A0A8H7YIN6_AJECA|nr:hypothetical protein I7I52_07486 [Histoplasma capsulatum]QSS72388.1 hypothetical protein I7I50_00217 [Histoplasma capsulatum G186AR]
MPRHYQHSQTNPEQENRHLPGIAWVGRMDICAFCIFGEHPRSFSRNHGCETQLQHPQDAGGPRPAFAQDILFACFQALSRRWQAGPAGRVHSQLGPIIYLF